MWRWYTAEDRRQAAATGAIMILLGIAAIATTPVIAGLILLTLTDASPPAAGLADWPTISIDLWHHPAAPAHAFGADHLSPWGFWTAAATLAIGTGAAYAYLVKHAYRLVAPTGTGLATRADVSQELSLTTCRTRAELTRPDLTRSQRRHSPAAQIGIPLHQAPVTRTDLWLPLENATGVIAPQQSGKSLMDLIHKVLAAPGGLIVTSTKLDLFLLTAHARDRAGSPVRVLDLTGSVAWPDQVRWNPIRGCTTVKTAKRRAQALLRATATESGDTVGNHAFFERRAIDVMTAYLLAAAVSGASVAEFVDWCQNDTDTEAVTILRTHPEYAAVRRTLQQAQAVVEETRSGIWETLRDAIACLTDPDVLATAIPHDEHPGLDPTEFIRSGGTIYVIGSEQDAATQASLITAFVQEVLDSARRLAIAGSHDTGHERLAPPFTAVLDEIASICPLPDLPNTLSDSAGRGVIIHYALQSPAQAQARWGKAATTLFDNTTALTIFGGLKSEDTLKWASLLAGRRLEERRSRQKGRGFTEPDSLHIGTERVDILEPAAVRQLPRGRALLIMRTMPPLIVHLKPAWTRPDWTTLQTDANTLRHGDSDLAELPARRPDSMAALR